ncbi:hypothetical protein [Hufsiella ginkgonis]|uniref:Pectate lyase superfamily protein domain-containing protein n=1 Tax=Hufsiella ginkgonis TaxID=2695274 RepID=A0A7K1XV88_9SPHI|nr:hypothetical protein [Hufsiella ginkgonis]MXV14925.1 hypothetical protein [Hufsiella ginkgonis]
MKIISRTAAFLLLPVLVFSAFRLEEPGWQSRYVKISKDGALTYVPDEKGNIIPDFSRVGYHQGDQPIPDVPVVKTISPAASGDSRQMIQDAINEVARRTPDAKGFRGAILLKKGTYLIPGTITVNAGGIVLRGEGDTPQGTRLVAAGKGQRTLLTITGSGTLTEVRGSRVKITDPFVPVGAFSFNVTSAAGFKAGDPVVLFRPGTENWIHDLKMDQIDAREGTKQWQPGEYDLKYERVITKITGNKIFLDNPVVMEMETKYGGGELCKYTFAGRSAECGVENLYFESAYAGDIDEDHGWTAVQFSKTENGWARNITSRYFGNSCVSIGGTAKYITVTDSKCLDAKSVITGSRRYSFNVDGQLNLVMNCQATEGRHDYVTGARVTGPNVFYNCTAKNTHADIGPHHRWATGTLFDNIVTDGEINVQDRGKMGSGHGWSGANQVMWNCTVASAAVQDPWVSARNYSIGTQGKIAPGAIPDRNKATWEGQNKKGLTPKSLYMAQLMARKGKR